MTPKPQPFFARYTNLVFETDLVKAMRDQRTSMVALVRSIPADQLSRLHAPYTWTPREVVGHVIDAERVFGYRAIRFARGDATPLPGFDQDAYVPASRPDLRDAESLVTEFAALRQSHESMFASLPEAAWQRAGIASDLEWTVTDLAKAIIGHCRHHETILRQRIGEQSAW